VGCEFLTFLCVRFGPVNIEVGKDNARCTCFGKGEASFFADACRSLQVHSSATYQQLQIS
jgi:hypothetical protein